MWSSDRLQIVLAGSVRGISVRRFKLICVFAIAHCLNFSVGNGDTIGVITAKTFTPPGMVRPASGDGKTNDTDVLQADIDYALAHQDALELEAGTYLISKPLVIEIAKGVTVAGFHLYGQSGPNRNGDVSLGGVAIKLTASGGRNSAVLEVGHGTFRDLIIENVGLIGGVVNNGIPYGMLFYGNGFSHATINNVAVTRVQTAFAEVSDRTTNEANGEFVDLNECSGNYCNNFYVNSFGQAYAHHLVNCCASLYPGGTFIEIGSGSLANSLDAFGVSCSFIYSSPGGPDTFIKNDGVNGNINIWGGRVEHVDTVLAYVGGSFNEMGQVNIQGVHFTSLSGDYPFINARLGNSSAQWTNTLENCRFDGRPASENKPSLSLAAVDGDLSQSYFDKCVFTGFANKLTSLNLSSMGIVVTNCRSDSPGSRQLAMLR